MASTNFIHAVILAVSLYMQSGSLLVNNPNLQLYLIASLVNSGSQFIYYIFDMFKMYCCNPCRDRCKDGVLELFGVYVLEMGIAAWSVQELYSQFDTNSVHSSSSLLQTENLIVLVKMGTIIYNFVHLFLQTLVSVKTLLQKIRRTGEFDYPEIEFSITVVVANPIV